MYMTLARLVTYISQQNIYLEARALWLPREQRIAANDIYTYISITLSPLPYYYALVNPLSQLLIDSDLPQDPQAGTA